ncbi:putative phiSLT protein [Staphylococcus aureus]|nr:putative phiSLT protein [Staphylococcus aureus]
MSVEIKGIPEVLNKLESVYGKQAMQAKSDKALNEASEFFIKALKKEFESFKDTGGKNIIHLNEHGYTRDGKKYTPRGFGVIAKTLAASERKYREIIKKELAR